jgi:hypothetical protein
LSSDAREEIRDAVGKCCYPKFAGHVMLMGEGYNRTSLGEVIDNPDKSRRQL